ncbi:MAG: hypothetical protein LBR13_06190 [Dysgonamonadaceae bacterium]|jgi:hypothetical protein|nr:hypothetical protein [Dysgonamonadaceae bacterium]
MKKEEVPQDGGYLKNSSLRDVYYALDENGDYCQVLSDGWDAKTDALSITWDNIREEAEDIRREVLAGKKSPLAYHLHVNLLDIGMLSAYSDIPKKLIKKHLQPDEFEKLDIQTLERYAQTLNITVDELKKI